MPLRGRGRNLLNRQIGNWAGSRKYVENAVGWHLKGKLPFAEMSFHDDEVRGIWWEGGDLVFAVYSDGYEGQENRIAFEDAQIVHENGWFGAPGIWWLHHELTVLDGGYEVRIAGLYLADDPKDQPPADRPVEIILRARDIRVYLDGKEVQPAPGHLSPRLLIAALHENAPADRRAEAHRRILSQPFPYEWLVHPIGHRSRWEGCAEVLCELDDETLAPLLPGLLEWLIDLDWPGARRIFERLRRMRPGFLRPALEAAAQRARTEDSIWLDNLSRLSE